MSNVYTSEISSSMLSYILYNITLKVIAPFFLRLCTPLWTVQKDRTTSFVSRKEWRATQHLTTTTMASLWKNTMEIVG